MEALIEDENAMDKGVADTIKDHKRKHDDNEDDDDEDPSAGPNQGTKTKRRRTKESESSQKPSTTKETPKASVLLDQLATSLFDHWSQLLWITHIQRPMATPLTSPSSCGMDQDRTLTARYTCSDMHFNLLKGTCSSSIELEYNFQECFNVLTDKLDWNNLEGDRYPFDLSKPIPLQGPQAILGVKSVSVKKLHGYGYLEEIVVKRSDQQLYKFKEEPYTLSYDPPGIVYEDLDKQKRVLRADELYKFSDGTLKSVRDEIHHRVLDFHLDYNPEMPKRKWTIFYRKRSGLMIELIDKQMREREIIRNLERLVGARELEMD
ncbi:hypothetical protein Tco_0693740 [Tanacetum coccineum]